MSADLQRSAAKKDELVSEAVKKEKESAEKRAAIVWEKHAAERQKYEELL